MGVCGIYCGACFTYRAYADQDQTLIQRVIDLGTPMESIQCKGCTSGVTPPQCAKCSFRDCAYQKGISCCFECRDMPCKALIELNGERARKDNLPHLTLCLPNLETLKKIGVQNWLKQQEERWSCRTCGKKLHWYSDTCPKCKARFYNSVQEADDLKKNAGSPQ